MQRRPLVFLLMTLLLFMLLGITSIVINSAPEKAQGSVIELLYGLIAGSSICLILLFHLLISKMTKITFSQAINSGLRRAILASVVILGTLYISANRLTSLWTIIPLYLAAFLVELYAVSPKLPNKD